MENNKNIGVFLCQCDGRIDPWIDLPRLKEELTKKPLIEQVEILPLSCTVPGIKPDPNPGPGKRLKSPRHCRMRGPNSLEKIS